MGFINEHTAEFILVPALLTILKTQYKKITPIYYWSSREGGRSAGACFRNQPLKVLAMYARRPKVETPGTGKIYIKLNELLSYRSAYLFDNGIPVIAGVPLANSLENLNQETKRIFFEVDRIHGDKYVDIDPESESILSSSSPTRALSSTDVFSLISRYSVTSEWLTIQSKIKAMGRQSGEGHWFQRWMSGDQYKPVYFLLNTY